MDMESVALAFSTDEGRKVHVVFQDITQRLKEHEELELLYEAVNQTEEGVVVFDSAGVVKYVNPAFERITGYLADEVLGRNVAEIPISRRRGFP
jgi:PAS domain-containing protein